MINKLQLNLELILIFLKHLEQWCLQYSEIKVFLCMIYPSTYRKDRKMFKFNIIFNIGLNIYNHFEYVKIFIILYRFPWLQNLLDYYVKLRITVSILKGNRLWNTFFFFFLNYRFDAWPGIRIRALRLISQHTTILYYFLQ